MQEAVSEMEEKGETGPEAEAGVLLQLLKAAAATTAATETCLNFIL